VDATGILDHPQMDTLPTPFSQSTIPGWPTDG